EMNVDITKSFPGRLTVDVRFTQALEPPTVLILFGPSGAGKTTVLRCLAGLEWPERGLIKFRGDTWLDAAAGVRLPPQRRALGYMPQDYALFPTHSVAGNIAFGLGSFTSGERQRRVAETVTLLQLQGVENLRPAQLSGGQQQRVALARALARHPRLLLLDEPLSMLDVPTRSGLRGELRGLLKRLAIPSVVVTHDWAEALALGDQMAVISEGRVLQVGTPQEVFGRPLNAEVARVVGVETVVQGRIIETSNGLATVEVAGAKLVALAAEESGPDVFVCIRAEDVVLETVGVGATSARNHLAGKVRDVNSLGALVRVGIDCGFLLSAIVTRSAVEDLHLTPGSPVVAAIKAGAVHVIPRADGRS
ncbi:MAG: ABC transporter ATP-binding protein, partial [Nitrospiraceae bacterium]